MAAGAWWGWSDVLRLLLVLVLVLLDGAAPCWSMRRQLATVTCDGRRRLLAGAEEESDARARGGGVGWEEVWGWDSGGRRERSESEVEERERCGVGRFGF